MSAVRLRGCGLTHAFGAHAVVSDVEIEVGGGELLVVVGPNGSGKTTVVRILSGVLDPQRGNVELDGRDLVGLGRTEIARALAVVPQELLVPFPFTVYEMVAMGRAPWLGPFGREGEGDRRRVEGALASLGLEELATRAYPTLSGGEKQRVLLARALAQDTSLLMLDEPTAHMDLGHRLHTFEWLREWIADEPWRRAVVLVTHDLVLAGRFADRIVLLDEGRVVASGEPAQVLTPERIGEVYGVESEVSTDASGRPSIVAVRSRIRYHGPRDGQDR